MKKLFCLLLVVTSLLGCSNNKKDLTKMKKDELLKYIEDNGSIKRKDEIITLEIKNGNSTLNVNYHMNILKEYTDAILKTEYDQKVVYLAGDNNVYNSEEVDSKMLDQFTKDIKDTNLSNLQLTDFVEWYFKKNPISDKERASINEKRDESISKTAPKVTVCKGTINSGAVTIESQDIIESRIYSYGEGVDKETYLHTYTIPDGYTKEELDKMSETDYGKFKNHNEIEVSSTLEGNTYTVEIVFKYTKDNIKGLIDAGIITSSTINYISLEELIYDNTTKANLTCTN